MILISRIVRARTGTGCGAVAISLASAFPQSTIVGVDLDPFSIARAEGVAASLSLPNLRFVCVSVRHHLPSAHPC